MLMPDISPRPKIHSEEEIQGPPRPKGSLRAPSTVWLRSPEFLEFMFKSLRPDNDHSLPVTISLNDLNFLVSTWNQKHPRDAVTISQSYTLSSIEDFAGKISLFPAISQFRLMNPGSKLNLATSSLASSTTPIITPTSPLSDKSFASWVATLYNRGANGEKGVATEVRLRLLDGRVTKNDLDWLCDRYEASHPKKFLLKVDLPFEPRTVSSVFPGVKLPPYTISSSVVPLAVYFLTGKLSTPLTVEQKNILSLIKKDLSGGKLTNAERNLIEGPVRQLAMILPPNSPVVQLRMRHLRDAHNETFKLQCEVHEREAKGELTERDKKLKAWIPTRLKQIEESYRELPRGANLLRFEEARRKDEIEDGDLFTLQKANWLIREEIRLKIANTLFGDHFDEPAKKIMNLPKGSSLDTIEGILKPYGDKVVDRYASKFRSTFAASEEYLKEASRNGSINPLELDNAKRMLCIDDVNGFDSGSPKFYEKVNNFCANERKKEERFNKAMMVTAQVVGTAASVVSQQYEAIPFIWLAGPAGATASRAYIEDLPLIDAAAKELKINSIFGTPGSVIGEHLTGDDAPAWKLLVIDILSMAAIEQSFVKGARLLSQRGALSAEGSIFARDVKQAGANRGIRVTDQEVLALANSLTEAEQKDVLKFANIQINGRPLPENLRRLLDKQDGKLLLNGRKGILPGEVVGMDIDPLLNHPAFASKNFLSETAFGEGKQSKCFNVKGHNNLVMIRVANPGGMSWWLRDGTSSAIRAFEAYSRLPESVNAPKILGFQIEADQVWKVMEKASGKELHLSSQTPTLAEYSFRLQQLAQAPQSHFDKLVSDLYEIDKAGLQFDPSKPDNIFYDPQKGFIIIDLDPKVEIDPIFDTRPEFMRLFKPDGIIAPILFSQKLRYFESLPPETVSSIATIIGKLEHAGVPANQSILQTATGKMKR